MTTIGGPGSQQPPPPVPQVGGQTFFGCERCEVCGHPDEGAAEGATVCRGCAGTARLQAALAESQARVEEYRREVERRDELLAGADADLRESQVREAALVAAGRALSDAYLSLQAGNRPAGGTTEAEWWREAQAALASPSAAAQALLERRESALLERVRSLEADFRNGMRVANALTQETQTVEEACTDLVRQVREARAQRDQAKADRDRWLGHVRALLAASEGRTGGRFDAARRDLAQHDGEGGR